MPSGAGDVLQGWREKGDVSIIALCSGLHLSPLKPQQCIFTALRLEACCGLRDIALGWLWDWHWPKGSAKALLPLSNSFAAEAAAGGRR